MSRTPLAGSNPVLCGFFKFSNRHFCQVHHAGGAQVGGAAQDPGGGDERRVLAHGGHQVPQERGLPRCRGVRQPLGELTF